MNLTLPRNRHLPPSEPHTFSSPVPAGQSVTAFEGRRDQWNGVIVYGRADHDLRVHVDSGTEFGGSIVYVDRRTSTLPAGDAGQRIPVECAAEWIRVVLENRGAVDAENVRVASYLSTIGMIPNLQKGVIQVWDEFVLAPRAVMGTPDYVYSDPIDLCQAWCGRLYGIVKNGTLGPSSAGSINWQRSFDGITWFSNNNNIVTGSTLANDVVAKTDGVDIAHHYIRLMASKPFGQPVTISAWATPVKY